MSAFIVSTETMHRVVKAIDDAMGQQGIFGADFERNEPGYLVRDTRDLDKLGAGLFALNAAAVGERYVKQVEAPPYRYRPMGCLHDVHAYRALACLIYQCAEGDIPERALFKALDTLRDRLACKIAGRLADEMKVPWDWPER